MLTDDARREITREPQLIICLLQLFVFVFYLSGCLGPQAEGDTSRSVSEMALELESRACQSSESPRRATESVESLPSS